MTHRKRGLVAGILVLAVALTPVAAVAGPHEDGVEAYKSGDYATALRLLRPLAEQGHAGAQHNLGVMYHEGQGVPRDYAEALKWLRLAAEQGDADSQYNLGFMYGMGQGVARSRVQAHLWFSLAATRWPPGENRDRAINNRDVLARRMLPAQIAEAEKLAREWQPRGEPAE